MALIPCERCGRHLRAEAAVCPFCERRSPFVRKAFAVVGGAVTTVVLAACYGGGWDDTQLFDDDGDGFPAPYDCDDLDPAINPDADEICDDEVDNDCNELVDLSDPACTDTDTDS